MMRVSSAFGVLVLGWVSWVLGREEGRRDAYLLSFVRLLFFVRPAASFEHCRNSSKQTADRRKRRGL